MEGNKKINFLNSLNINIRVWSLVNRYNPYHFIVVTFYTIVNVAYPYINIYFSAKLITELSNGRNYERIKRLIVIILIVEVLLALLKGVLLRLKNYENRITNKYKIKIFNDKFLSMDYSDVDSQKNYELYTKSLQNEMFSGLGFNKAISLFEDFLNSFFVILGGVSLSYKLFLEKIPSNSPGEYLNNPLTGVVVFILLVVISYLSSHFLNKAETYWSSDADSGRLENRIFSFYGFAITERQRALDMRIYNQYDICKYFSSKNSYMKVSKVAKYAKKEMALYYIFSSTVSIMLMGAIYTFVCLKSIYGAFGIGSITLYIGAITKLLFGIGDFIKSIGLIQNNAPFLDLIFRFLDIENTMYQGNLTPERERENQYLVEFENVSFKYPGSDKLILKDLNIKFKVGKRLAIVGENGSGKTTFIKLLCRLYDPTDGRILLNGIDIKEYSYKEYIDLFSPVFQDFKLLSYQLGENIATNKNYDKEKVLECIEKSGFINRYINLNEGLDTYLYKDLNMKGVDFSGGESQKIAIARALYKNSNFIILDEPTAALDPLTEAEIYDRFKEISSGKTTIFISHRLSSCKFCDEIVVFDNGKIIEKGKHEDLVSNKNSKYYELWESQAKYYVEET